jgi:hypothetical protein
MDATSPSPQAQASALAMIADGRSVESVAGLFGVSVDVLRQWMREPPSAHAAGVAAAHAPRLRPAAGPVAGSGGRLAGLGRIAIVVALIAYILWAMLPVILADFKGSPPIEQLERSEGWVKTWRDCHRAGRNLRREDVTLVGARSTITLALPCVLPPDALADGKTHRMTVLWAWQSRIGAVVYDVTLDGRTLQAYADTRRPAGTPWFDLGILAVFMAVLLPILVGAIRAFPRASRQG